MPTFDYDLMVIGGGSAGVRCSRMAADLGARVVLCEDGPMGGTCVNVGCVPKKLFSYGAHFADDFEDAAGFGWDVSGVRFDWGRLIRNKNAEIERLNGIYDGILERAGVEVVRGRGVIVGPHAVSVGDRLFRVRHIAIATGGRPWLPDITGGEHIITSDDAFYLPALPDRVVVAGGGYIAVEFASFFRGFGVEVDLVHRGEVFLRGFDLDCRHHMAVEMRKKGIRLHFDCTLKAVEKTAEGLAVHLTDGESLICDTVLGATGRRPRTDGLGLEDVGVEVSATGGVLVDAHYQTSVPSIWAIGDVIERVQLTPVALAEGTVLARRLFADQPGAVSYDNIATTVFAHPNLAEVGLTEEAARARFPRIRVYKSTFRALKHTLSGRDEKTFMKLVVDDATDRVVGCHMIGADAGELIQGLAIALNCGATKAQFDATIGVHPTAAEEFVTMRTPVSG